MLLLTGTGISSHACFSHLPARAANDPGDAVYGTTSLKLPVFLSGMFVGSLKPYLLDSCECLRRVEVQREGL